LDVRRHGKLWNPGIAVHLRRGNRHARVEMPDHARDLGIDELLGNHRSEFRFGLIVFGDELELDRLVPDLEWLRVELAYRKLGAVLIVLAVARLPTGQRRCETDLDDFLSLHRGGRQYASDSHPSG